MKAYSFTECGLIQLDEKELIDLNGGIFPILLAALAIYGGVNAVAYGAGYIAGTIHEHVK